MSSNSKSIPAIVCWIIMLLFSIVSFSTYNGFYVGMNLISILVSASFVLCDILSIKQSRIKLMFIPMTLYLLNYFRLNIGVIITHGLSDFFSIFEYVVPVAVLFAIFVMFWKSINDSVNRNSLKASGVIGVIAYVISCNRIFCIQWQ